MKIQSSLIRVTVLSAITLLFFMGPRLKAQVALEQLKTWAGTNVSVPGVPNPTRVSTSSNRTNSPSASYLRHLSAANKFNEKAIHYMNTGDYRKAVSALKKARWYDPFNQTVASNLKKAISALQNARANNNNYSNPKKQKNNDHHSLRPKPVPHPPTTETPSASSSSSGNLTINTVTGRKRNISLNYDYYRNMSYMQPNNGIEDKAAPVLDLKNSREYKLVQFELSKIGSMANGGLAALVGKFNLNLLNNTISNLQNATNLLTSNRFITNEEIENLDGRNVLKKTLVNTVVDEIHGKIESMKQDMQLGFIGQAFGKSAKTYTKLGIGVASDIKSLHDIYKAPSMRDDEQH